jgi:hypothetical protein
MMMSVGGAPALVLEMVCWLSLQPGHWRCKCSGTQQVCRILDASTLHSRAPEAVLHICTRFPFSHFQGLRSVPFWRRAVDPACSKTFTFHQLKLPQARPSTRQAASLRSTIALLGSISSTSPGTVAQSSQHALDEEGQKSRRPGEVDPLRWQWRSGPCWGKPSSNAKRREGRKREYAERTREGDSNANKIEAREFC